MFEGPGKRETSAPKRESMPKENVRLRRAVSALVLSSLFASAPGTVKAQEGPLSDEHLSLLKSLKLESLASRDDIYVSVPVPSPSGRYIVQLDQAHGGLADKFEEIAEAINVQQSIESVMKSISSEWKGIPICLESNFDTDVKLDEYDVEKEELSIFAEEIATIADLPDFSTRLQTAMDGWSDWFEEYHPSSYAQRMTLLGAATALETIEARSEAIDEQQVKKASEYLHKVNPFDSDARYYTGAFRKMYFEGTLTDDQFIACESEKAFADVGSILTGGTFEHLDPELDEDEYRRLDEIREDAIVENISRDRDDTAPITILVLGAKHDLSDNIQKFNSMKGSEGLGYIVVTPLTVFNMSDSR